MSEAPSQCSIRPRISSQSLRAGQLLSSGYSVLFENEACTIHDSKTGVQLISIPHTHNNMFPLDVVNMGSLNVAESVQKNSKLWRERYGHLNYKGLKQLEQEEMVEGLPHIMEGDKCEDCVAGKQSRNPFLVGKAWKATENLHLVHMDIYGPMQYANRVHWGGGLTNIFCCLLMIVVECVGYFA